MKSFSRAKFLLLAAVACGASPTSARAQQDSARARTIRKTTAVGQEVRIYTYTQHHRDCSQAADPAITLLTRPANGIATIRASTVVSGPPRFDTVDCSGKQFSGLGIFYAPAPGFRGTDRFDYEVGLIDGTARDTAVIDVK